MNFVSSILDAASTCKMNLFSFDFFVEKSSLEEPLLTPVILAGPQIRILTGPVMTGNSRIDVLPRFAASQADKGGGD